MAAVEVKADLWDIEGANAVWMDPVSILSCAYCDYKVSYSRYYSRSAFSNANSSTVSPGTGEDDSRKRKKRKRTYTPNEKEVAAELRHQESRSAILNAHSLFIAKKPPAMSPRISLDSTQSITNGHEATEVDFVRLAEVWQASMYELNVLKKGSEITTRDGDGECKALASRTSKLFGSLIEQEDEEAIAECAGGCFLLPRRSRFLISDVTQIHQLIPAELNSGYNLILIDPPWENKSVHRKSLYPTLPNRQLLSIPIKQLVCSEGALLALWITNREKLHQFVEKELFPAWGVKDVASWYWLKVNNSGEMISPLDLQHHKPYECLLLGYVSGSNRDAEEDNSSAERDFHKMVPPDKFVIISVPGDHSRKPPIGSLLAQYAPGPKPINGLELFARELNSGWTSWGNEPLRFQSLKYFERKA